MPKKVYVAMRALPWERLNIALGKNPETGEVHSINANGDDKHAGFLPVYWDEEAAKQENPNAQIQEGMVGDDWGKPELEKAQGDQGLVLFGKNVDEMNKGGLVDLAKIAEDKLTIPMVLLARERALGGKEPTTRFGAKKLKKYLEELHAASQAR
jgi:hypothetical protein